MRPESIPWQYEKTATGAVPFVLAAQTAYDEKRRNAIWARTRDPCNLAQQPGTHAVKTAA
jgi:hypothetical protein